MNHPADFHWPTRTGAEVDAEKLTKGPAGSVDVGAIGQKLVGANSSNDAASVLTIPGSTFLFRLEEPRVAIVQGDGKVRLQPVTTSRELDGTAELADGVRLQDTLIVNAADSLESGDVVQVVPTPTDLAQRKVEEHSVPQYHASNPISAGASTKSQNLPH